MKVRSFFQDVDQPIGKAKLVPVKNKTRQAKYTTIGHLPQPVLQDGEAG